MSRRVRLPAADDLFRPTSPAAAEEPVDAPATGAAEGPDDSRVDSGVDGSDSAERGSETDEAARGRRPSGRVRHDEKMTVYVTSDELLDLEHARLVLRRHHGLAVDRGRLVREAVAIALADLEDRGKDSVIVQRLTQP